jgi:hypothetical protein
MDLNQMWDGIFPFDELDGDLVNDFQADDLICYFGFQHFDVSVLVFIYIDDRIVEIRDVEGETDVSLYLEVEKDTIWSVADELVESTSWGLAIVEEQSVEWMFEGAKAETGAEPK